MILFGTPVALVAQRIPYGKIAWPERIAVGMRQGDQLGPLTVEATNTGWVVVSFLSTRPDEGLRPPPFRMMAEARDVRAWADRARRLLDAPAEAAGAQGKVTLGNGAYEVEIFRQRGPNQTHLSVRTCGPGHGTFSPSVAELLGFVALMDSAATTAGGGEARPPTLSRPYYGSEVSCPVAPNADNQTLKAPRGLSRIVADIGTRFVVDTTGRVERGSIRFLPGADTSLARRARAMIRQWRFRRAEIDGTPVRQIVQTTVGYAPSLKGSLTDNNLTIIVEPTDDGWVHLFRRWEMNGDVLQQWFEPDSVDLWLSRMWGRDEVGQRAQDDTARLLRIRGLLGPPTGTSITSTIVRQDTAFALAIGFNGCYNTFNETGRQLGTGAIFTKAAAEARKRRATPANPTTRIHTERDVACPAWLEWTRSARKGFERVWNYPVAPYPESMRATNARAEILVSFVVDTAGSVEPGTVAIIPDSDPRAVTAIPSTLDALRFRPATRSGRKVRQRVIQVLRFEPPPTCATLDASPSCPRRYSKN